MCGQMTLTYCFFQVTRALNQVSSHDRALRSGRRRPPTTPSTTITVNVANLRLIMPLMEPQAAIRSNK